MIQTLLHREPTRLVRNEIGELSLPDPLPDDPRALLELMDEASAHAATAHGVSTPVFDHGMRVFNQLHAHYQILIAKEIAEAHQGLSSATNALKVATWALALVTIALAILEIARLFGE